MTKGDTEMGNVTGTTEWRDAAARAVSAAQSTALVTSSPTSRRIDPEQFAAIIGPCLTLVAPSGMSRDDRRGWAHAAHQAIGDVAPDMLKRAAAVAMRTADHPSKIVPAITKAIQAEREEERVRDLNRILPVAFIPHKPAPVPHDETQAIIRAAGLKLPEGDPTAPKPIAGGTGGHGRMPSAADYKRLFGIDIDQQPA